MKVRRVIPLLLSYLSLVIIGGGSVTGRGSMIQPPSEPCTATLAAWDFPEAVPEYVIWESFFQSVRASESAVFNRLGIDGAARDMIKASASHALSKVQAVRAAASESRAGERRAAEATHHERDELIRTLSQSVFDRVSQDAHLQARHRPFVIPAPGKTEIVSGVPRCRVTVKGPEFPHLIPESMYWEFYLTTKAIATERFRTGPGIYAAEHIRAIQLSLIPVDAVHVQKLLEIATDTKLLIDSLRQTGADDLQIAQVVREARASLIRSMPKPVWILVNRDAERTRDGSNFRFPRTY